MRNTSLLTYVLYGLLAFILIVAGYYTCQKQKESKLKKEQDEAELQQTLRNMGYGDSDSTDVTGSSFVDRDSAGSKTSTKPTVSKNGIEQESPTTTNKTNNTVNSNTKTAPNSTNNTVAKPTVKKSTTAKSVKGPGAGRWAVRAGTFAYMDGARRRLEEVIKLGYPNAEISKTNEGKAAVVVFRSNNKNAAIQVADDLEDKGVDAAVFDRNN